MVDEKKWNDTLKWMWKLNPSISYEEKKYGWAIENERGKIYGFIGNIPVEYLYHGTAHSAIWGTSWYVDEEVREIGLRLYINFIQQKKILLSNSQTGKVEIVMMKLGFKKIPSEWFKKSYLFPLKIFTRELFKTALTDTSFKKVALALLGMLLKIPQSVLFLLCNNRSFAKDIELKKIDTFPDHTDVWFEEFKKHNDCTLIRNKEVYNWLFCTPYSEKSFLKFEVTYRNKIQGYLIYKIRTIKDFKFIEIIDEALLPLSAKVKRKLIMKSIFNLYAVANNESFLILNSNMEKSTGFFRGIAGIGINKIGTGFVKSPFGMPDSERSLFTSIDGDSVFF